MNRSYTTADIRNIALVGHSFSGKTTLAERLLVQTKAKGKMGTVEEGSTTCDFDPEEKTHKHTISSAIIHVDHEGRHINVIDTPGFPDFFGQAVGALPAVETAAIVIDAHAGIQTNTRRMLKTAADRRLPRIIIINKIDHENINLPELLRNIRETFGPECTPINLPCDKGTNVVDLLESHDGRADFSSVAEGRTALMDQIVEVDDALMTMYLESPDSVPPGRLHEAIEEALRRGHLVPICFCSAKTGAGVDDLLHIISHVCPSPLEGNPRPFEMRDKAGAEQPWRAEPDPKKPVVAHVFKITSDPFVGKLAVFRVHQGTISGASSLLMDDHKKPLKIGHVFKLQGKEHVEADQVVAGDIGAVAKIEEIHPDAVLHESHELDSLHIVKFTIPKPMAGLAVIAKSRNDEAKIGTALHKLAEEDATFTAERVAATHELVIRGMGEMHLRVMIEKLKGRYSVEVETHQPKVAYKETIKAKADGHHRHKKQTGGAGQFGEVFLRVEPLPADHKSESGDTGFEFVDDTFGGSVPKQYLPAIEKGVRQVLTTGAFAGFPLTGVRVSVYDGKYHPVDSKEVAFVTAGRKAFIDAVAKARPSLLEPFVDIEVSAPSKHLGDITADLIAKRGRIQTTDVAPGDTCVIRATAPLSELMAYSSQLKSMTAGAGSFTMEYSHDEQTPHTIQEQVVAAFKPHHDED